MNEKQLEAIDTFKNGYNCAQSVLSVFAQELGMSKDAAMKLASPFGSGIAYMQETCGAVTGGLMAIGLKYGKGENGTTEEKERAYDMSRHFIAEFKKQHETLRCLDLMDGLDMTTPEGMKEIVERDLFRLRCAKHVTDAIVLVEKIIDKKK